MGELGADLRRVDAGAQSGKALPGELLVEVDMDVTGPRTDRPLVLAVIEDDLALGTPPHHLPDVDAGIHPDAVHRVELQCPLPGVANVAEAGGQVDEEAEPGHGGSRGEGRRVVLTAQHLDGVRQVEPAGFEDVSVVRDLYLLELVGLPGVERHLLVDPQGLAEAEVVAVRVDLLRRERVDGDATVGPFARDLATSENHGYSSALPPTGVPS